MTETYNVHTMGSKPGLRIGVRKLEDGSAKVLMELHVKKAPSNVGEAMSFLKEKLCLEQIKEK